MLQRIGSTAWGAFVDMGDKGSILTCLHRKTSKGQSISRLTMRVALPNDFLSYSFEDFRVINVNLKGPFVATQRAAQSMKEHRINGAIVNIIN